MQECKLDLGDAGSLRKFGRYAFYQYKPSHVKRYKIAFPWKNLGFPGGGDPPPDLENVRLYLGKVGNQTWIHVSSGNSNIAVMLN